MLEGKNCAKRLVQHRFKPKKRGYFWHKSLIVKPSPWSDPISSSFNHKLNDEI